MSAAHKSGHGKNSKKSKKGSTTGSSRPFAKSSSKATETSRFGAGALAGLMSPPSSKRKAGKSIGVGKLTACVLAILLLGSISAQAQSTNSYTLQFNHDGVDTDGYIATVDGVRVPITPTCTGTGAARVCTSPLTLTTSVTHTVNVIAFNVFGEATSDVPFVCKSPGKSTNVKVGK